MALFSAGCGDESINLDPVTKYACIHAENGPFEDITAESLAGDELVAVDRAHTAYNITLPTGTAEPAAVVQYTAKNTATYVFLTEPEIDLRLVGPSGEVDHFGAQSVREVCPILAHAQAYDLDEQTSYELTLGPTEHAGVQIIIEEVSE